MGIEPGFLVHAWSWQRSTLFFAALHSRIYDGYQQILMHGVQGKGGSLVQLVPLVRVVRIRRVRIGGKKRKFCLSVQLSDDFL